MTVAEILVLVAALLPYAAVGYAKHGARATFDNANPRNQKAYTGAAQRAHGAHLNGFETFPLFAIAVLLAELHAMPQPLVNYLALAYVLLRIAYTVLYIKDKPTPRSIVWSLGFLITVIIFLLPILLVLLPASA